MSQVVSFSLFRFGSLRARVWAFVMMGLARRHLRKVESINFWKLCGSGSGEGFTPIPNTSVYAILATWPDEASATRAIENDPLFQRYKTHASEHWSLFMSTDTARGAWSGKTPFIPTNITKPAHWWP